MPEAEARVAREMDDRVFRRCCDAAGWPTAIDGGWRPASAETHSIATRRDHLTEYLAVRAVDVRRGFRLAARYIDYMHGAITPANARSVPTRVPSMFARVIARELELCLARSGRPLVMDIEEIQAMAEHLAGLFSPPPDTGALVDARVLAEQLGVARDWVYAHAEQLGGVRLGTGPRARLRFDAERARAALAGGPEVEHRPAREAAHQRRGRPRRVPVAGVSLIQGRSSR
jgi:hypothetical protein